MPHIQRFVLQIGKKGKRCDANTSLLCLILLNVNVSSVMDQVWLFHLFTAVEGLYQEKISIKRDENRLDEHPQAGGRELLL